MRALATSAGLEEALGRLAAGPYGHDVHPGQDLGQAQHAVAGAFLWNLRVLAGWLPREGTEMARLLAGWAEIANVDAVMATASDSGRSAPVYELGSLATAWPRLATTANRSALRQELAASPWGDPGAEDAPAIQLGLRLAWSARVSAGVPPARAWASGAVALIVAHEVLTRGSPVEARSQPAVARVLGVRASEAGTLADLRRDLPASARWALGDSSGLEDLWRAEARWWRRVEGDALSLKASSRFGLETVLGAVALLAVDAWRVRAALELAARGGRPPEAFDAVV
jgi:hypothetical protein